MRYLATALKALAFLWACAATLYILISSGHVGPTTSEPTVGHMSVSLVSANGPWVVGLLVGVTLIAGLPFGVAMTSPDGHRAVTWGAGLLLLGFSLIAGFALGLMYLPAAVVLLVSAATSVVVRGGGQGAEPSL